MESILALARQHRWLVTAAQLSGLGLDSEAVRHHVKRGRLHRLHPGVYTVGRPELTRDGWWHAATLACADSVLSHYSAGALWGVLRHGNGPVHVTVPTQAGRMQRTGVVVHRCRSLGPTDCTWRERIPVTKLPRTLRDLAGVLDDRALTQAVRQAELLHRLNLTRLAGQLRTARPNAARERRLLRILERYVPGEVRPGLEERMLELCGGGNLPVPVTQHEIGGMRVDFAWPSSRLAVEVDDRWSHQTAFAFQEDRARDRRLGALGWTVLRFTWADVTERPGSVREELEAAIARAGVDLSVPQPR